MSTINLPKPVTSGGMPLMDAINLRYSCKKFDTKPVSMELISGLLWAACGFNRPDLGKLTVPTARNAQEMRIYAIMADGAYLYDPKEHLLELKVTGDLRTKSSIQDRYFQVPLHLAYVGDYSGMDEKTKEYYRLHSHSHAGFIGQNVYLYCASVGLGACFIASFDMEGLNAGLDLSDDQTVVYTQAIGYPLE